MKFDFFKKFFSYAPNGTERKLSGEKREQLYNKERPEDFRFSIGSFMGCFVFLIIVLMVNILIFIFYRVWE